MQLDMIGQPLFVAGSIVIILYGLSRWWLHRCGSMEKKWVESLKSFVRENDGKKMGSGDPLLLIVCPASGRGKAMSMFPSCLQLLIEKGFAVEVYVTKDGTDIETLSERKDLGAYKAIAVLAGDSSIFQLIQTPLQKTGGKWPYAPILHLPGGSGNVISGEFHNWAEHTEIIPQLSFDKVVKGTVIKISSPGTATRYAIHNCFDGFQRVLLERINNERSLGSFGMAGMLLLFVQTLLWRVDHSMTPFYLLVVNSDVEGMGNTLGFGIRRTDDKLAVVQVQEYKSFLSSFSAGIGIISGKIARQASKNELPDHISVNIGKKFTFTGHDYHFVFDGHTDDGLSVQGNIVTVESVPDAVPYMYI